MKATPDLSDTTGKENTGERPELIALIKEYIETNIEIGKLTLIGRATVAMANLITDGFVLLMLILVFLFGSISLSLFLGERLGSPAGGFGIVTLIYLVFALVMFFMKDKFVEKYLINFMIKRITNKRNNGKEL
jgi:hypothetical protein